MSVLKRLHVLCPQEYEGTKMYITECSRCHTGWDKTQRRCTVGTGAEHLPQARHVPTCPIQDRCQHQVQSKEPCTVRSKGLVCESALIWSGMSEDEAMDCKFGFNATVVIAKEDL